MEFQFLIEVMDQQVNSQDPGKVWKGKKMAGQLGNKTISIQNLEVVSIDEERGLLLVKGGVPGAIGGWVAITDAKRKFYHHMLHILLDR